MIKFIEKYILTHWQELFSTEGVKKPQKLNYLLLQRYQEPRPYETQRIVILFFIKNSCTPLICAKLCKDKNYESSLEHEFNILNEVYGQLTFPYQFPIPIKLAEINGSKVLFATAVHGMSLQTDLYNIWNTFGKDKIQETIKNHFELVGDFIKYFYQFNIEGDDIYPRDYVHNLIKPVIDNYLNLTNQHININLIKQQRDKFYKIVVDLINLPVKTLIKPKIIHGDLVPANIFLSDSNSTLGIIDWESAHHETYWAFLDVYDFIFNYFHICHNVCMFENKNPVNSFYDIFILKNNWFAQIINGFYFKIFNEDISINKLLLYLIYRLYKIKEPDLTKINFFDALINICFKELIYTE